MVKRTREEIREASRVKHAKWREAHRREYNAYIREFRYRNGIRRKSKNMCRYCVRRDTCLIRLMCIVDEGNPEYRYFEGRGNRHV